MLTFQILPSRLHPDLFPAPLWKSAQGCRSEGERSEFRTLNPGRTIKVIYSCSRVPSNTHVCQQLPSGEESEQREQETAAARLSSLAAAGRFPSVWTLSLRKPTRPTAAPVTATRPCTKTSHLQHAAATPRPTRGFRSSVRLWEFWDSSCPNFDSKRKKKKKQQKKRLIMKTECEEAGRRR